MKTNTPARTDKLSEKGAYYLGECPKTICWVPDECLEGRNGLLRYNKEKYMELGLHIKNMKENIYGIGGHLFPKVPLTPATQEDILESQTLPNGDEPDII